MTKNEELIQDAIKDIELLEQSVETLESNLGRIDYEKLIERLAVLETHVAELKRNKEEADKRQWQFVYIFAGGMTTLLITVVVQLVIHILKK